MSFAVIKRVLDEEDGDEVEDSELTVDLKVASCTELEKVAAAIQQTLKQRSAPDLELVAKQMQHIEAELAADVKTLPFSLEHLELYEQYLNRFTPDALSSELKAKREKLLRSVQTRMKEHPLAGLARSGDTAGNEDDFRYFKIPLNRRKQMMVLSYFNLLTGPPLTLLILFLLWRFLPFSNYLLLAYATWIVYDTKTRPMPAPDRVVPAWRRSAVFQLFRDYFPIRTMIANRDGKEQSTFDKSKHYLFCYHPHGVQSAGAFSFGTAASGFDELLPGLTCSVQTLGLNFKFPLIREYIIALGFGDASKAGLLNALGGKAGSSAMLVTGGAKESMFAHPGNSKIVMKDRAGFVKIALMAGASLVPVWGFGENNLYENLAVKSSSVRKWQRRLQKAISFAPLLMEGRGIFSYGGGLIPHRRPITVVIGDPVRTGKPDPNPSNERIAEVHKQYQDAVTKLFETYKDIYDPKAEPLEFV